MRKNLLSLIFILCSSMGIMGQIYQIGYTKEYLGATPKRPLGGVELMVDGAGSSISAEDGSFTLCFNNSDYGDRLLFLDGYPYLSGYEVFNQSAINVWNLSKDYSLDIVLCKRSYLAQIEDSLNATMRAYYKKELESKQIELEEALRKNKIQQEEYEAQIQAAQKEHAEALRNLRNYIDQFAHIDLSEVNTQEQKILSLVSAGKIEDAINQYEDLHIVDKRITAKQNMKAAEEGKRVFEQEYEKNGRIDDSLKISQNNYISTLKLQGGKESYDRIERILVSIANADSTDLDALKDCALFFYDQGEFIKAEKYFKSFINHSTELKLSDYDIYSSYISLLISSGRREEADDILQKILLVIENLPSGSRYVFGFLYIYKMMNMINTPEENISTYFHPTPKIQKIFAEIGMTDCLRMLSEYMIGYSDVLNQDYKSAIKHFKQVENLLHSIPSNQKVFIDKDINIKLDFLLAGTIALTSDTITAFPLLKQSEIAINKLYDDNPTKYGPLWVDCLFEIATINGEFNKLDISLEYLQKAITIAQSINLEQRNPIQYAHVLSFSCITSAFLNDTISLYQYLDYTLEFFNTINPLPDGLKSNYALLKSFKGIYYAIHGNNTFAEAYLLQALEMCPTNTIVINNLVAYYNQEAYSKMQEGNFDSAFDLINKAIKISPNDPNLLDSKGEFCMRSGDFAMAIKLWEQIMRIEPNFYDKFPGRTDFYNLLLENHLLQ